MVIVGASAREGQPGPPAGGQRAGAFRLRRRGVPGQQAQGDPGPSLAIRPWRMFRLIRHRRGAGHRQRPVRQYCWPWAMRGQGIAFRDRHERGLCPKPATGPPWAIAALSAGTQACVYLTADLVSLDGPWRPSRAGVQDDRGTPAPSVWRTERRRIGRTVLQALSFGNGASGCGAPAQRECDLGLPTSSPTWPWIPQIA